MSEYKMVGWYYKLNAREFEQALGVGEGQGSPTYYSPSGCRVRRDLVTEQQHYTNPVTLPIGC